MTALSYDMCSLDYSLGYLVAGCPSVCKLHLPQAANTQKAAGVENDSGWPAPLGAMAACKATHQRMLSSIKSRNNGLVSTYELYGQRDTLEQFGVAQHGLSVVLTKHDPFR